MRILLKTIILSILTAFPMLAQVPNPQIPLTGTAGAAGNFPLLNSGTFAIPSDANFTPTFPNTTCIVCKVTSSVSLTATRNLIEPTAAMTFNITNATTGGQSILVKAATGTGVTIANGVSKWVWFDGTNYVEIDPPGSGSSLPTASAPGQIISSTAAGTAYAVQPQIFYNQTGDTISSIETECSSVCTYIVTMPQTITLTGNHTLNANVSLRFEKGGIWIINGASDVLTIGSGKVEVPTPHIIFAVAGTATVAGLADSYPDWFGGVMSQTDEALRKAVAATGDGSTFRGIIHFRATQYWSDYCAEATNPFSKNYITFQGAGKPMPSLTRNQLIPGSGTILIGCLQPDFSGLSLGLHLSDIGIDRGFTVDATYFAGAQENSFIGTTWSGDLNSPYGDDFQVNNVAAMVYDTAGIRHAFAFEHASNGVIHGLYTYGGNFGVVNKSLNMQGDDIHIEAANTSFIFKSDNTRSFGSWTNFSNIYISDGLLGDGSGDHLGTIGLQVPGNLNNTWTGLNISNANIQGQSDAIEVDGISTGIHLSGVTMDNIGNFCLKSTGGAITDFSLHGWTCTRYNASGGGNPAISLASNFANPILSDGYMSSSANVIAIDNFSANATLSNITVQASGSAGFGIFGETSSFAHVTHFKANGVVAETAGATADIAFDIEALNRTDLNQQTLGNAALLGVGDGAARGWLDYAAADTLSLRSMGSTTGTPGSTVFRNFSSDLSVGGIVLTISPFGNLSGPGTVAMTGQINSNTGFEVGGLAPSGHCLLGNGTNYVDGICSGLVNPMTTLGDIITGGASGSPGRLGIGSTNQVLTVVGGVPAWAVGGGNVSTSGSPTTGFVPLWASSTTIGNSLLDYGVTTASKFTMGAGLNINDASGLGGGFDNLEGTAHTGAAGKDELWADSTAHRWVINPNNAGAIILSGIASAGTSGHCVQLATNGIDLADSGLACGGGGSGTVNSGTIDGAAYYTGTTAVSSTTAPTTAGHTYFLAWQPSGSAIAPVPLDIASPPTIGGITGVILAAPSGQAVSTIINSITTFQQSSAANTSTVPISVSPQSPATSIANFSSPAINWLANYWNGTVSTSDTVSVTNVSGAGTNPTQTLTFAHPSGSSGVFKVAMPALAVTGITGSTQCVQADTNGNLSGTGSVCGSGGAVSSVSNSDGTLTISPTTGAVVASLALAHANTWSGQQTFVAPILGTPASGTLTNTTGLPAASVVAGALANGMTATTQTVGDNTTKLATDAFVLANAGGSPSFSVITAGTNTAALVEGTGGSITRSGTGIIDANKVNSALIPASGFYPVTNTSGQFIAQTKVAAMYGWGDSYMVGLGATDTASLSFFGLMSGNTPAPPFNFGIASTPVESHVVKAFANFQPGSFFPNASLEDDQNSGTLDNTCITAGGATATACINNFKLSLNALIAWVTLPFANQATTTSYKFMASVGTGGTWAADTTTIPLFTPTLTTAFGTAMKTTTSSTTRTFSLPLSTVVGVTYATANAGAATFTVSIDGTPQTDLCSGTTTFTNQGCGSSTLLTSPTVARQEFTVSSATHSVVITSTSANSLTIIAVDAVPPATNPNTGTVVVLSQDTNRVNSTTINTAEQAVIAQFVTDGVPIVYDDLTLLNQNVSASATNFCPATTLGTHPNDCYHRDIATSIFNTEIAGSAAGAFVFSSNRAAGTASATGQGTAPLAYTLAVGTHAQATHQMNVLNTGAGSITGARMAFFTFGANEIGFGRGQDSSSGFPWSGLNVNSMYNSSGNAGFVTAQEYDGSTAYGETHYTTRWGVAVHTGVSYQFGGMSAPFINSNSGAPTFTAGTGAGTSPTITLARASSLSGIINVTTGSLPTGTNAAVVTVIFNSSAPFQTYQTIPKCFIEPSNLTAGALVGTTTMPMVVDANTTTAQFVLTSGTVGLVAATAYQWIYTCTE